MKIKELMKQRKVQIGIGVAAIVLLIVGFAIYEGTKTKIEFQLDDNVLEYGDDIAQIDWQKRSTTNGNQITLKELDTKNVGETEVVFTVCIDDTCKDFKQKLEIKDTKNPEIKLKADKVEITEDDDFDPFSNIESIKDPIDGDIKKSDDEKLTKNGYLIVSDVDNKKAGKYTVKITAYDMNGNKAEGSYQVTVKEKPQETQIENPSYTQGGQTASGGTASSGGNTNSGNSGGSSNGGNTAQEQPHYRTDISNTYFAQINAWRQQNGLEPYPHTAEAQAEADRRAMELVSNFSHAAGVDFGENIGKGNAGLDLFEAWKASPNHNGAMLERSAYTAMAVSVVEYQGYWYAVTSFRLKEWG